MLPNRLPRLAAAALLVAVVAMGSVLHADARVVLHEFIPPDPREDLQLAATSSDGRLPAAIETPSGLVQAPDTDRAPTATEKAYSEVASAGRPDAVYRPDRDTRRPAVASYDDPFIPTVTPYKRLRAYDGVAPDMTLVVMDATKHPVPEGGAVRPGEDVFFGDMTVDLAPGEPVRIPSVGPGARVVRKTLVPPVPVEIVRDGAHNWFVRGSVRARVRLILQLAAPREVFGGELPAGPWRVQSQLVRLPPAAADDALEVAKRIGIDQRDEPRAIVAQLVGYFRSFEPSDEPPRGQRSLYLDLALSRKGVCRHRAYAFVITALALGIPARMVVNEAHAWVEVYDGTWWRRIDLGGAATELQSETSDGHRVPHVTPADPFPWPRTNDSGQQAADRAHASAAGTASAQPTTINEPSMSYLDANLAPSSLTIVSSDARALRGSPLLIEGLVRTERGPCSFVRVDVALLEPRTRRSISIGSLSSDEQGRYKGAVVVPLDVALGDYDLMVSTPGGATCGPGRSAP